MTLQGMVTIGFAALVLLVVGAIIHGGLLSGTDSREQSAWLAAYATSALLEDELRQAVGEEAGEGLISIDAAGRRLRYFRRIRDGGHRPVQREIVCKAGADGLFRLYLDRKLVPRVVLHDLLFEHLRDEAAGETAEYVRTTFWATDGTGTMQLPFVVITGLEQARRHQPTRRLRQPLPRQEQP